MNKLKRFSAATIFALLFCLAADTFAQENKEAKTAEPSYEVLLQILVASNAGANKQMPSTLGNIVKKLKTTFPFNDYRIAATYLNRVENGGGIETRSVIQEAGDSAAPLFQEISLGKFKKISGSGGQPFVQIDLFRFGMRVPVQQQSNQGVSYEQIGLTVNRVGLAEDSPTIIGTLPGTKSAELIVLVMTVRTVN